MMKTYSFIVLLSVLFASQYALAQAPVPSCPCDTAELPDGSTGNDIVEILCPGGVAAADTQVILGIDTVELFGSSGNVEYEVNNDGETLFCDIQNDGLSFSTKLSQQGYQDCYVSLVERCSLRSTPIPTLGEWGMMATAGVLGLIGLFVAVRRRKAAA